MLVERIDRRIVDGDDGDIAFARKIEPSNPALAARERTAQALRDAGAVTAGHLRLRKGPWRVVELTQEALEVVSASASHRRQTLVAEVGCPDEVVHVDHERMVQVLVNLLCNAIKFTTAGGSVTLRAHLDGRTLCFQVQDTGIGILPEYHGRIFEQFMEPSEASHRDPKRGLGIGLYLARALTRLHGGDITVASRPGAGSTFTSTLPPVRVRKDTTPSAVANRVWSRPTETFSPGFILVPRWRTRMLPARTFWPPKRLTPSRLLSESRPLREEPPAFLCAIVLLRSL